MNKIKTNKQNKKDISLASTRTNDKNIKNNSALHFTNMKSKNSK